jgi:hypothetical protein
MDSVASAGVLLAAVAVADGIRALPAGAILIRHLPLVGWRLADAPEHPARLRLLSWCIPLSLPLVVDAEEELLAPGTLRRTMTRLRSRRRRVERHLVALRALGMVTLATLIAALPLLVGRSGVWGLIVGLGILLALCLAQFGIGAIALARGGASRWTAALRAAKYLWPFTAPRAAEEVQRQVAAGVPALVLLHELLPPNEFAGIARPLVYDVLAHSQPRPGVAALMEHLGLERAHALIATAPERGDGDAYCPRCGKEFYAGIERCSDCIGVGLVSAVTPGPPAVPAP